MTDARPQLGAWAKKLTEALHLPEGSLYDLKRAVETARLLAPSGLA